MGIKKLLFESGIVIVLVTSLVVLINSIQISHNAHLSFSKLQDQYFESTYDIYKNQIAGNLFIGDYKVEQELLEELAKRRSIGITLSYRKHILQAGNISGKPLKNYILKLGDNEHAKISMYSVKSLKASVFFKNMIIPLLIEVLLLSLGFIYLWWRFNRVLLGPLAKMSTQLQSGDIENYSPDPWVLVEIEELYSKLKFMTREVKEKMAFEALAKTGEIATQVAHDIRSPLTSLNTAMKDASALPEAQRKMIRSAAQRINDIANNLLSAHKSSQQVIHMEQSLTSTLIFPILDSIISEKRMLLTNSIIINFNVDRGAYIACANIRKDKFSQIISNLINNSIDAMDGAGVINILLKKSNDNLLMMINDNGKGISKKNLEKVFTKSFSFGKKDGMGIGLYYAKKHVEEWRGSIAIASNENKGTEVTVKLPRTSPPIWLIQHLIFPENALVIVLDDDESIHHIWDQRLTKTNKVIHFSHSKDFIEWWKNTEDKKSYYYLFDYELIGDDLTGLDIILRYNLSEKAVLVTSHYENQTLIETSIRNKLSVLPKNISSYIALIWLKARPDAVIIDDDDILRQTWELEAIDKKLNLYSFASPDEFERIMDTVPFNTPIYIDSKLSHGLKGEIVSKKYFDQGFKNIYLITGYEKTKFKNLSWIKDVKGKDFSL
jgi:signal transduction histidine kinase